MSEYILTARQIMDAEGIDQVSIRKVARLSDCNSATMYLYFKDLDELVTLAAISYLEDYCMALCSDLAVERSAYDLYIHTWDLFCDYAFRNPMVYYKLFFGRHTLPLGELIERYYSLFPEQIENADGTVRDMLLSGDLSERNLKVLRPLVEEQLVRSDELDVINEITVCYFRKFLEELCHDSNADTSRLKADFLKGAAYLLKRH